VKHYGLDREPRAELFMPAWQQPLNGMALVVRTASDPKAFVDAVRRQVLAVDAEQPIFDASAMVDVVARSVFLPRISMVLLVVFAATALLLAAIGIYGVVSYTVAERTRELGVRMALGADATAVVRLVLGRVAQLLSVGIGIGTVASLWASTFVRTLLFGLEPHDPLTLVVAALTLTAVGAFAAWLPARVAARIDPATVLREG